MQDELITLLRQYEIDMSSIIEEAIKCQHSQEKWQKFMSNYIDEARKSEFLQRLIKINILQGLQAQQSDIVANSFQRIVKTDINIQNIFSAKITEYKWGDQLMNQIRQETAKSIKLSLSVSIDINQFLALQIDRIFDILSRRCDLKQYFDEIKLINKQLGTLGNLNSFILNFTFRDFVIILTKYVSQQRIIGSLLNSQGIPIPILAQTQKELFIPPELSMDVFAFQEYSLILNIGTKGTRKCGKSFFISKLMSIKQSYLEECSFISSINLTNKINFSTKSKLMLCDFNGEVSKQTNKKVYYFVQKLAQAASLLIIHLKQQELLVNNVLKTEQFQTLCQSAQKIIIFIRDVQNRPMLILKKAEEEIPNEIRYKTMIRCLKNFEKTKLSTEHKEQLQLICRKGFNSFQTQWFSYMTISEPKRKNWLYNLTKRISKFFQKQLYAKQYSKKDIIPLISNIQELRQIQIKIKDEETDIEKVSKYDQTKKELISRHSQIKLSNFVEMTIQFFSKEKISLEIFQQYFSEWKNNKQEPLRKQFLQLSDKGCKNSSIKAYEEAKIKEQIINNLKMRNEFELSIDKIIGQLISFNHREKNQRHSEIIKQYLDNQMENLYPINIVDGNTLKFGNQSLKTYFQEIAAKYSHKKIYTISVIGAQSSAKSTLLNYLFRCRFQTSAGRCTKGVYMNICEIEDIVVIVLDTQGLLSVSARDKAFDHQMATFVLKVSNLVIINNKGELTNNLTHMLEVCLYVLQCLHKDQKKDTFSPKKILFSLRDQSKPKGNIQQQMAGQIKNTLQQMKMYSNLDYRNFISIQVNDILSLPNAFTQERGLISEVGSINLCEESFGNCILGMRKRIVDCLQSSDSPPFNSLYSFYQQAQNVWYTIQSCGKQIMNYKTIAQIRTRQSIEELFRRKTQHYYNRIINIYEGQLKRLGQINEVSVFDRYQHEFDDIRANNLKEIVQDFAEECKNNLHIKNQEWIKAFDRTINAICRRFAYDYKEKFQRLKKNAEIQTDEQIFERKISQQFKYYLDLQDANTKDEEIIANFNKWVDSVIKQKSQLFKFEQLNQDLQLKNLFNSAFHIHLGQLKLNYLEDCSELYSKYEKGSSFKSYINFSRFLFIGGVDQSEQKKIQEIFHESVQNCKKQVNQLFKNNQIKQVLDIHKNSKLFLNIISRTECQCKNKLDQLSKGWIATTIQLQRSKLKQMLIGYLFKHIKDLSKELKNNENNRILSGYQKIGKMYKQNLKQMIESGKDIKQAMNIELKKYQIYCFDKAVEKCKDIVQNELDKISLRLNPEEIFRKAMRKTFLNEHYEDKKRHYIECFKVIKNINAYLFQVLCEQEAIVRREDKIYEAVEETHLFIKRQITTNINLFVQYFNLKDVDKIIGLLQSMKMLGFATKIKKQQTQLKIFEQFRHRLLQKSEQLQKTVLVYLKQQKQQIKIHINNFILQNLTVKIMGCDQECPACGMKCMKQSLHDGGHKIPNGCHVMQAFGGISYAKNNMPSLSVCMTQKSMRSRWVSGEKEYNNCKEMVADNDPQWVQQFSRSVFQLQNLRTEVKYKQIWANIQTAIIKHRFNYMVPSEDRFIRQKAEEGYVLTENDMQQLVRIPLTQNTIMLKDY